MKSTIHFIITGGTIDSYYDPSKGTAIPNKTSIISTTVGGVKLHNKTEFTTICMKDSRDLTEKDLQKILATIEKSKHRKIIVTHGTYTMDKTAHFLQSKLKRKDQIVILTGAMIPINGFYNSDAQFNLGYAVAKLEDLEPGVYVAMNGQIFTPDTVVKNIEKARFDFKK